jgi:hypothetical protein
MGEASASLEGVELEIFARRGYRLYRSHNVHVALTIVVTGADSDPSSNGLDTWI